MTQIRKVDMSPEGPQFSEIVQGYWRMAEWGMSSQEAVSFLKKHVELGITTVDHAHVYGSNPSCEDRFGQVLKRAPEMREQIEIVSKCGIELFDTRGERAVHFDSTPSAIVRSVETSLARLNIERLDVLLLHLPDFLMDVDAVAQTFDELKQSGKVKHFGVSNFASQQFSLLQSRLTEPLITNQVEINPLNLASIENGSLDQLYQHKVRPMAWSCLGGGRIFTEKSEQITRLKETLACIRDEIGAQGIDQVIYAWVRSLPSKPVAIIGSGEMARIESAVEALNFSLSRQQWYRIWVASKGLPLP